MYKLTLKPQDCLFFRDGKPFGVDASHADTVFPPYPSTFMGALRTLIITTFSDVHNFKDNKKIKDIIGSFNDNEFTPSDKLKIRNIILTKDNKKYYSSPADLCYEITDKDENNLKLMKFSWTEKNKIPAFFRETEFKYILLNRYNQVVKPLGSRYLEEESFIKYLRGKNPDSIKSKSEIFYFDEEHIKNSLDRDKRTTKKTSGIFSYNMKRIDNDISFEIYFEGPEKINDIDKVGFIKLGGESRVVYYEIEKSRANNLLNFTDFDNNYSENDLLKIIIQTPLISNDKIPEKFKIYFDIIGIAVSGKIKIGGWDMLKKHPKPMYDAYSPGTIFLVKENEKITEDKYSEILKTNFSDIKSEEGFGKIHLGIEKTGGN